MHYSDMSLNSLMKVLIYLIVCIVVCLILDLYCVVKRYYRTLSPLIFLLIALFQTGMWTAALALTATGDRQPLSIATSIVI